MNKNLKLEYYFVPVCSSIQMEFQFWIKQDVNLERLITRENKTSPFSEIRVEK